MAPARRPSQYLHDPLLRLPPPYERANRLLTSEPGCSLTIRESDGMNWTQEVLGPDNAIWDDGEWVSWEEIGSSLDEQELRARYPNADPTLVRYFEELLSLAEGYNHETGRHLQVYGDIGELFCAITLGMKLHRHHAQGSDGRRGNDFIEVKTIAPFSSSNSVQVKLSGHFSHLFVARVDENFEVSGRMIARRSLPSSSTGLLQIRWDDLPS